MIRTIPIPPRLGAVYQTGVPATFAGGAFSSFDTSNTLDLATAAALAAALLLPKKGPQKILGAAAVLGARFALVQSGVWAGGKFAQ